MEIYVKSGSGIWGAHALRVLFPAPSLKTLAWLARLENISCPFGEAPNVAREGACAPQNRVGKERAYGTKS